MRVRQRWHQRCRIVSAATARSPCGVCQYDGVACRRAERVGPQQRCARHIALCHRQANGIDVAADHAMRNSGQGMQFGADGARHVVDVASDQTLRAVGRDNAGSGLLHRVVREQPLLTARQFGGGFTSKQDGVHERRHVITETRTRPADVGQTRTRGQFELIHLGQGSYAGITSEIVDVAEGEVITQFSCRASRR